MHAPIATDPSFVLGQVIAARRILAHLDTDCADIPEDQYCIVMMWLSAWAGDLERTLGVAPSRPEVRSVAPAAVAA